MYQVDENDRVTELAGLPPSCMGAPLPIVIANEHRLIVAYLVEDIEPGWDGKTVRPADASSTERAVAVVEFEWPSAHYFGPPNDEAFSGHPLASRGLEPYGAFEVLRSSWIRLLEQRNRVHSEHRPELFASDRHFILTFHDSVFECIARGYRSSVRPGSLREAARSMAEAIV